jgi:NAD+ kinase
MQASFKTVALVGKYKSSEIGEPLLRLAKFLVQQGYQVLVARQTGEAIENPGYDLANL